MNFQLILSSLLSADPEFGDRISARRRIIRNMARATTLAALPTALGALLKRAYGKQTLVLDETLNFALRLERLERAFYDAAIGSVPFPTAADRTSFETIRAHETAHVRLLEEAVRTSGAFLAQQEAYDFTAGDGSGNGPFADVFSSYPLFLAVAQTLEDAGVRAYKGGVETLATNSTFLSVALRIHTVEARHAAHIRYIRRNLATTPTLTDGDVKPWVTRALSGIQTNAGSATINAVYAGEEITVQAGVNIITATGTGLEPASEAFDEPLTAARVLAILDPFFA